MKGWNYLGTLGLSLDVYGQGKKRKMIDRETGIVVNEWET